MILELQKDAHKGGDLIQTFSKISSQIHTIQNIYYFPTYFNQAVWDLTQILTPRAELVNANVIAYHVMWGEWYANKLGPSNVCMMVCEF